MRRLYLLMAPVAALGLLAVLLVHAIAFGTPAGAASRIACRPGQPCAYFGVMATANPGAIGNELLATAVVSSSDAWAGGRRWEHAGSVARKPAARGSVTRGPKQGCGCAFFTLIEHYNGATWSVVSQPAGIGPSSEILGMTAISTNDVWAVGDYLNPATNTYQQLIEHWDGATWSIVAGAALAGAKLTAIAGRAANDVWAVGSTGQPLSLTEHWDGTVWSVVPSPNATSGGNTVVSPLASVTAIASNDVWAVGSADLNTITTLIEHWDGTQWSIIPSPNTGAEQNKLFGVSGVAANDVWAVGSYFDRVNTVTGGPLVEHWDGASWTIGAAADPPSNQDQLLGVAAQAAGEVWAAGSQSDYDLQHYTPLIERWTGVAWGETAEPPLSPTGRQILTAVAVGADGTAIAVGYYPTSIDDQTLAVRLGRRPR
ncbi:MAG TPA: hypothetical protein VHR15_00590 [Ktedonobacterales bacterium]|jgi:hypothetical protein|nr:hypothetical protein [Ktedonobacterales bacterium]